MFKVWRFKYDYTNCRTSCLLPDLTANNNVRCSIKHTITPGAGSALPLYSLPVAPANPICNHYKDE